MNELAEVKLVNHHLEASSYKKIGYLKNERNEIDFQSSIDSQIDNKVNCRDIFYFILNNFVYSIFMVCIYSFYRYVLTII